MDAYRFPGFIAQQTVKGVFGDSKARVIKLNRRQKKQSAQVVVSRQKVFMTTNHGACATFRVATPAYTWNWKCDVFSAGDARK